MRTLFHRILLILSLDACTNEIGENMKEGQVSDYKKSWQGNITLLSSLAPPIAAGQLKALLNVQFPDPGIYTVEFSIVPTGPQPTAQPTQGPSAAPPIAPLAPPFTVRALASLNWMVGGGGQVQRIFDVGNGTTISGAADGINLQVQDFTSSLPASGTLVNGLYTVTAQITKGTRGSFLFPPFLFGSGQPAGTSFGQVGPVTILPGGNAAFIVPQNSGVVSAKVMAVDVTTPGTRPTFVVAQARSGPTAYNAWIPDSDPSFVPIPSGTQLVNVLNLSGTDTVTVTVLFGVDG